MPKRNINHKHEVNGMLYKNKLNQHLKYSSVHDLEHSIFLSEFWNKF